MLQGLFVGYFQFFLLSPSTNMFPVYRLYAGPCSDHRELPIVTAMKKTQGSWAGR